MAEIKRASKFVWYELHTRDAGRAAEFYGKVIGWTAADSGMPHQKYLVASIGERMVAGLLEKKIEDGMGPMWVGYVGVEDVNDSAAAIVKAGGVVHKGPEDIPGVGRFAVVGDPQGAIFCVFQPGAGQGEPVPAPGLAGTFGWSELAAADWEAVWPFYEAQFGWVKSQAMDMGSAGMYQMFNAEAEMLGGMMTRMDSSWPAAWLYYINVDDADATVAAITEAGGKVVHGPAPVPGGQRIAVCVDAQGAPFGIVAPK
jgi:predicted enzyme related to lactoylglutathione lyase